MARLTAGRLPIFAALFLSSALVTAACGGEAAPPTAEEQALHKKAYEAALWAAPILNSLQLRAELRKHGAKDGDLAFVGSRPTGRIELPTLDTTAPYVFAAGSLKDGPVVIHVPPASARAKFVGSVMNIWDAPIEDFGPDGADGGRGGRFVLLPPGSTGDAPAGYTPLASSSYEFRLWLQSVPARGGDDGWREAVEYLKGLKVYPLADAAKPPAMGWFDVSGVKGYFHGNPYFGRDSFKLIDEYVQNEPAHEADEAMLATLAEVGIVKGRPFAPDDNAARVLDRAAKEAEEFLRAELEHGRVFEPYWSNRAWGGFKPLDGADYRARAANAAFFAAGLQRETVGDATLDLMSSVDGKGRPLDGGKTWRLRVPARVPVRDSWSIVLYSTRTRSIVDTEKFRLSSKDRLQVNRDGSVDLHLSPLPPAGLESNWLATRPGEKFYACVRFNGPQPALPKKAWVLGDFEETKK